MSVMVPICVTLRRRRAHSKRRPAGQFDWPPWAELGELLEGLPPERYFDVVGSGWVYEPLVRIDERGAVRALCLVPEAFGTAAAARWPSVVEVLDDEALEDTWAAMHDEAPAELVDREEIATLYQRHVLEQALGVSPAAEELERRRRALDPNDPTPGVVRNPRKRWSESRARIRGADRLRSSARKRKA